ncbi:MAG: LysM peptidoglycan-binding domain-containing protein [Candidatus Berkelbacteria bacterium]|nr:LysM peptidoglycan-binding domain-containing protein [Candidatus Berkelbacteria bacterium]
MLKDDTYTLSQQLSVNAGKEINEPQRVEATYTVKQGETITQIAQKFDLHVGTILEANKIPAEQSKIIKPGTILKIPSSDTVTSSDWLVTLNRAEEAERKAAEQKRQEELRKQLAKRGRAYAASSYSYSSGGYAGVDRSGLIVPISHNGISRGFSWGHSGIDYRANVGTPVRAAASGE